MPDDRHATATVARTLRVVPEFRSDEFDDLAGLLSPSLDRRLSRFRVEQVEMELSVKDRETPKQRVVLEAWIAEGARQRFVATSTREELRAAVIEVRDDMRRQVNRHLTKQESRRR